MNRKEGLLLMLLILSTFITSVLLYQRWGAWEEVKVSESYQHYLKIIEVHGLNRQSNEIQNQIKKALKDLLFEIKDALEKNPRHVKHWYLLGELLSTQQYYAESAIAFQRAEKLLPNDSTLTVKRIEAEFFANRYQLSDKNLIEVKHLLNDVTLMDTHYAFSLLNITGLHAFKLKNYKQAIKNWHQAQKFGTDEQQKNLQQGIEKAQQFVLKYKTPINSTEVFNHNILKVNISFSRQLEQLITAHATSAVFVYIRQHKGKLMPLAIKRFQLASMPDSVQISTTDSMMGGAVSFVDSGLLEVVIRISHSGTAQAQAGDWQGKSSAFLWTKPQLISIEVNQVL